MKLRTAVAGAALATAALGLAPAVASAAPAHADTTRKHACVDDLYVRAHIQTASIGLLKRGGTFDVEKETSTGNYSYGHAYGEVNLDGWVRSSGLC